MDFPVFEYLVMTIVTSLKVERQCLECLLFDSKVCIVNKRQNSNGEYSRRAVGIIEHNG